MSHFPEPSISLPAAGPAALLRREAFPISSERPAPGLGRPGIDGSKGKPENEWGESPSALLAAHRFGRDKHFPLDAWL